MLNLKKKWYPQRAGRVDLILERAQATGKINDPVLRQEIAKVLAMSKAAEWAARRARTAQDQGRPLEPPVPCKPSSGFT